MQNNQGLSGKFCTVQGTIFLPPESQIGAFFMGIWKKVYVQPYKIIYLAIKCK